LFARSSNYPGAPQAARNGRIPGPQTEPDSARALRQPTCPLPAECGSRGTDGHANACAVATTGFETHLILPVPAAEPVIGAWRERFDPRAQLGVPPHITALGPFVDRRRLTIADLQALTHLFASTSAITFKLVRVASFADVVYLAPEPSAPFVALTEALWQQWPAYPPYAGAHREIVPHLTVAVGAAPFAQLAAAITPQLPVTGRAGEAWLVAHHDDGRYRTHYRFAFGASDPRHGCAPRMHERDRT